MMSTKKRVRRTKEQIEADKVKSKPVPPPLKMIKDGEEPHTLVEEKVKGLGDVVDKFTEATGIKKLVKFIAGEDCGCEERKEFLNKLFPMNAPKCLTETEFNYLDELFKNPVHQLVPSQQSVLLGIYQRVFNEKRRASTCPDCWRDILNKLKQVHESYQDGIK